MRLAAGAVAVFEAGRLAGRIGLVVDQPVLRQIVQRGRRAMLRQIGGAGHVDQFQWRQRARDQRLVHHGTYPYHQIEAFAQQVDAAVCAEQVYLQLRMRGQKPGQLGADLRGQTERHIGPYAATQLVALTEQGADVVQIFQ
jgi:hypothetical protein